MPRRWREYFEELMNEFLPDLICQAGMSVNDERWRCALEKKGK